jgi:hypothetical protein
MSSRSCQKGSGFALHLLSNGPQVLFAVTFVANYFGKTIRDNKIDASAPSPRLV